MLHIFEFMMLHVFSIIIIILVIQFIYFYF